MISESTIQNGRKAARRRGSSQDDKKAFREAYDRHAATVNAYALRRAGSSSEAADVVSETFLVLWRRFDERPEPEAMQPWLLGIARRVLSNQRRSKRRQDLLGKKLTLQIEKPRTRQFEEFDDQEDLRIVGEALQMLKPDDREILLLVGWEQLEPAEIATVLGISGNAARKRLHRARRRLRKKLRTLDEETLDTDFPLRSTAESTET